MQQDDFSVKATPDGYRIFYKGRSIGGVGENPEQGTRDRITAHRQADLIEHREAAKREIESLLAGFG